MRKMFGRKQIFADCSNVTRENLTGILSNAIVVHNKNKAEIEHLEKYMRGDQPILRRTKEIRPEINNTVVENRAWEITSFLSGYLLGEPCTYVRRGKGEKTSDEINSLNEYMFAVNKPSLDKELINWVYCCGQGYRMIRPESVKRDDEDAPFDIDVLDPRKTFIVYNSGFMRKRLAAFLILRDENGKTFYAGYTPTHYFEIRGSAIKWEAHTLGDVPIYEYIANDARLGAFEPVLGILDAINTVESNRLDGIEQFIQSLAIAVNCQFEDGITANEIRKAGMLILKSVGENKADFKILSEQLDQLQTQTLIDYMKDTAKEIVGMPNSAKGLGGGSSGNVGSVMFWQGWETCEARAKDTELLFDKSEKEFLRLALKIMRETLDIDLKLSDVTIKFTRRQYDNILTKTQSLQAMLQSGLHPEVAIAACGLFNDPMDVTAQSAEYLKKWKLSAESVSPKDMNGGGSIA